jgi:DNA-binding protein Fis
MVRQIVRLGIQTLPEGALHDRLVGDIERELIGQVMCDCEQVQVKAAQRLGINRNTLHKKLAEFEAEGMEQKNN